MNRLKTALSILEERIQSIVEGNLARLFTANGLQHELTQSMLQAMRADTKVSDDGQLIAPNLFTIYINPSQKTNLTLDTPLLDELATYIEKAGSQAGLQFLSPPVVRVSEQINSAAGLHVTAQISVEDIVQTSAMSPDGIQDIPAIPKEAYLIIDGTRIFSLDKSVINIGRRSDNHLVIDDARISRVHAQLRVINGRFIIFDLDSLGGTFLNNQRIKQSILSAGDVVSLAGVPLVYGQESDDLGDTQKINAPQDR